MKAINTHCTSLKKNQPLGFCESARGSTVSVAFMLSPSLTSLLLTDNLHVNVINVFCFVLFF